LSSLQQRHDTSPVETSSDALRTGVETGFDKSEKGSTSTGSSHSLHQKQSFTIIDLRNDETLEDDSDGNETELHIPDGEGKRRASSVSPPTLPSKRPRVTPLHTGSGASWRHKPARDAALDTSTAPSSAYQIRTEPLRPVVAPRSADATASYPGFWASASPSPSDTTVPTTALSRSRSSDDQVSLQNGQLLPASKQLPGIFTRAIQRHSAAAQSGGRRRVRKNMTNDMPIATKVDVIMSMIAFGPSCTERDRQHVRHISTSTSWIATRTVEQVREIIDRNCFCPPSHLYVKPGHCFFSEFMKDVKHTDGSKRTSKSCPACQPLCKGYEDGLLACYFGVFVPGVATGFGERGSGNSGKPIVPWGTGRSWNVNAAPQTLLVGGRNIRWVLMQQRDTKEEETQTTITIDQILV
jgi:hypothetical protein